MNRVLIDTDILSYYFKGDPDVLMKFKDYIDQFGIIEISLITFYEILSGLQAKNASAQIFAFANFASENLIHPLTERSVKISAELYATLKQTGNSIDDIDLLIAGVAIENEMTLVTNNEKHFGRIPGLKIKNWKKM